MPRRVLIVDDEKDMLALLQRIISEETDYELVSSSNPFKALRTAHTNSPIVNPITGSEAS